MRRIIVSLIVFIMISILFACSQNTAVYGTEDDAYIPNPFVDCDTMKEAAGISGFEMTVPDAVEGYDPPVIQAIEGELIQVSYKSEDSDSDILIRKGIGTDDISGVYTVYSEEKTVPVEKYEVTMKGEKGMVNVATWTEKDFLYAIDISGIGIPSELVLTIVKATN